MFLLKQYDLPLLSFDFSDDPLEGQKCHIIQIEEKNRRYLPIGMDTTDAGLMKWLRGRIIPKNREYVDALLAKCGLSHSDTRGILRVCKGLFILAGIHHLRYAPQGLAEDGRKNHALQGRHLRRGERRQ